MTFIETNIHPESGKQNPADLSQTTMMIHISAILALKNAGSNKYEVILKPEYLSTIQSQVFGHGARIKTITALITKELLQKV